MNTLSYKMPQTKLIKKHLSKALIAFLLVSPSIITAQAADKGSTSKFTSSISDDGIVAVVNDSPILKSDLDIVMLSLTKQYKNDKKAVPTQSQLKKMALNNLILRHLQLSRITRSGIRPSDTAINTRMAKFAQSQGLKSIVALQKKMDAKKPGRYASLRRRIIEDLSIKAVRQNEVASRVKINQKDVDAFLASPEGNHLNQNQYQTIHFRVPFPKSYNSLSKNQMKEAHNKAMEVANRIQNELKAVTNHDNQAIAEVVKNVQKNYPIKIQGGNTGYHSAKSLPSDLAKNIVNLEVNQVGNPLITSQGIDVIKLINKKVANDMVIPQWHTKHILVSVDELTNNQMAKLQIDDLYEQLKQGASFSKLALTYSNDPGSAGKGGDLDWVSEGNMVPEFENMMKKTVVGDFSIPFKSQYGWHILQVVKTRKYDASNQILENIARDILFKRAVPQIQEDWLQELKSSAYINILEP